jgi:hypothetical protein
MLRVSAQKCRRRFMKKLIIGIFLLSLFVVGLGVADSGINQTPETQGITIATTVDAQGSMTGSSTIEWVIAYPDDVRNINLDTPGDRAYSSSYTEETASDGIAEINYGKTLNVETSEQLKGLSNIEAEKTITFFGENGADISSEETIFVDGAGTGAEAKEGFVLCPMFPADATGGFPGFCNRAEAGSKVIMSVANVKTTTNDRFIIPNADQLVELNHDINVDMYDDVYPSIGEASAYMEVLIQESRWTLGGNPGFPIQKYEVGDIVPPVVMNERIKLRDDTKATGYIFNFDKEMHYESGIPR